jgi:hypothetical protein
MNPVSCFMWGYSSPPSIPPRPQKLGKNVGLQSVKQRKVRWVGDKILAHFHTVAIKRDISIRNWLLYMPGRIPCEQSAWCQGNWWVCSWLCFSHISPCLVSLSLDFPCTAQAFFPQRLSNHCQGLSSTVSKVVWCTSFVGSIAESHQARYTMPYKWT